MYLEIGTIRNRAGLGTRELQIAFVKIGEAVKCEGLHLHTHIVRNEGFYLVFGVGTTSALHAQLSISLSPLGLSPIRPPVFDLESATAPARWTLVGLPAHRRVAYLIRAR